MLNATWYSGLKRTSQFPSPNGDPGGKPVGAWLTRFEVRSPALELEQRRCHGVHRTPVGAQRQVAGWPTRMNAEPVPARKMSPLAIGSPAWFRYRPRL